MNELLPGQFFPTDHVEHEVDEDVDYSIPYEERVQAKLAAQAVLGIERAEVQVADAKSQESTKDQSAQE